MSEREYAVVYEKVRAFERSTGNTMSKRDLVEAINQMEEALEEMAKALKKREVLTHRERVRNLWMELSGDGSQMLTAADVSPLRRSAKLKPSDFADQEEPNNAPPSGGAAKEKRNEM